MSNGLPTEPFRLWKRALPFARTIAVAMLPVPDLISRYRVRHSARRLVALKGKRWPGMDATGTDAMQLAMCRLLFLQRQTRWAVLSGQAEAATVLARAAIDTLLTGLYCRYESDAVSRQQAEYVRQLPLLFQFLVDAGVIPSEVLAECISRLDGGSAAKGPTTDEMAEKIDEAIGADGAIDLYNRYYRSTSSLAVHGGAASLLRHVNSDEVVTLRPVRIWPRQSPARIADACTGILAANLARLAGSASPMADNYADRHLQRAMAPVVVMAGAGFRHLLRPGSFRQAVASVEELGRYISTGQDSHEPVARTAHIRATMSDLLSMTMRGAPAGALDPFLDFVSADIVAKSEPEIEMPTAGSGGAPDGHIENSDRQA